MTYPYFFEPNFLSEMMTKYLGRSIVVHSVVPFDLDNSTSILVALTAGLSEKPIGHFGLKISYSDGEKRISSEMVLKVKPHGDEIAAMLGGLAMAADPSLGEIYARFLSDTGFKNVHGRELEIYNKLRPAMAQDIFGTHADLDSGLYFILMENLCEHELLNTVMSPDLWTDQHIRQVLAHLAQWHVEGADVLKSAVLDDQYWDDRPSQEYMESLSPLWESLVSHAQCSFPELYTTENAQLMREFIGNIRSYWETLAQMPMTLVHNDCNPRNLCFKRDGQSLFPCLYDWELATVHTPAYDVVEFLSFVLDEDRYDQWVEYIDFYFEEINRISDLYIDKDAFLLSFKLAARDFGLHRLGMYMMAHSVAPYPFLPRVVKSYFHVLRLFDVK